MSNPFQSPMYQRHSARRLEHLGSLSLDLVGKSVLEVGGGDGHQSSFFIDRGCRVLFTDSRQANLNLTKLWMTAYTPMMRQYAGRPGPNPTFTQRLLDLENPPDSFPSSFDVVYNYGVLYHVGKPKEVLEFLAPRAPLTLVETCLSFGTHSDPCFIKENKNSPTQSSSSGGCRPTRPWVCERLSELYKFVYNTRTQPWHAAYPLDWTKPNIHNAAFARGVFIGSQTPIANTNLVLYEGPDSIPMQQVRH